MTLKEFVLDFHEHIGVGATEVVLYMWLQGRGFGGKAVASEVCSVWEVLHEAQR